MMYCWIVFLALTSFSIFCAENNQFVYSNPTFTSYTHSGVSSIGNIRAVNQGNDGFIWLTTASGLYRYDGHSFKNIPLIDDPDTFDLVQDFHGKFWISTLDKGLYKYDPVSGETVIFQSTTKNNNSLNSNELSQLTLNENTLWIASAKGVNTVDVSTNKIRQLPEALHSHIADKSIKDILIDSNKYIWLTTFDNGVFQLHEPTNNVRHFTSHHLNSGLTTNKVTRLLEDNNGVIWLGSFDGVFYFNRDLNKFEHLSETAQVTVSSLMQDSSNSIWIGTWESGAIRLEKANSETVITSYMPEQFNPDALPHQQVFDVYEDSQKNLWFASSGTLSKLSVQARNFKHLTNPRKDPCYIRGLIQSIDSSIWFSCTKDLYRLTPNKNQTIAPHLTTSGEIYDIKEDHQGNLWLSFYRENYLLRYNPKDQSSFYFYANKGNGLAGGVILDLQIDSAGKIWVGTYAGHLPQSKGNLFLFDELNQRFNKIVDSVNVLTITELESSNLLLTTPQGISIFDKDSNLMVPVDSTTDFSAIGRVNTAFKDRQGNVWLSIFEYGLFIYNREKQKITEFKFPNNRSTKDITNIVEDSEGNIWFASGQELIRYDKGTKKFSYLDKESGIQVNKFMLDASLLSKSGNLLFAGVNNIIMFEPNAIFGNSSQSIIRLTELKLSNKPVAISSEKSKSVLSQNISNLKHLTLTYKDYLFSLSFSLLNFNSSLKDEYAYKLEGIDKNWVYTDSKNRIATYTTIPAGEYTFRYKGKNQNTWVEGTPLGLSITPPLWLTWQAYLFYILLFIFFSYLFITSRIKSLKNQAIKLEQGIQNKTKELQEKSEIIEELLVHKKQLFTNISHEFRTPISLILAPIESLLESEKCNKKVENYVLIKRNSQRLLRMVEQLLELSKLDSPSKMKFCHYSLKSTLEAITAGFESAYREKNIFLTVSKFDDVEFELIEDSLEKILINLLTNALKYTKPNGQVRVEVCHDKHNVQITVVDNGIGIRPENYKHVFERFVRFSEDYNEYTPGSGIGLSLVKELVEANNGEITFSSILHEGTSFTVTLPRLNIKDALSRASQRESHIVSDIELELTTLDSSTIQPYRQTELSHLPKALIIEDNKDMRDFLANNLNDEINCITAASGKVGFELALKYLPDIIISDVMMPEMDGLELVKVLKENDVTSHIPIIMLSAKGDLNSRLLGWEKNVDEYMPKPFHLVELKLRIKNILSIRKALKKQLSNDISKFKPKWDGSCNNKKEQDFIDSFEKVIAGNYINPEFKRGEAADCMAMSERQLNRKLSALFDLGFSEYVQKYRLRKATKLLGSGLQVNQICYDVGFNSPSYFIKCFKKEYGKTVKQFEEDYCTKNESENV